MTGGPPRDVDEYIDEAPAPARPTLQQLRETIRAAAPQADERISYKMPYYHYHGRLAYFSAHAHHVGLYPFNASDVDGTELQKYAAAKATLQFPFDEPLPVAAIRRLIQQKALDNEKKGG